MGVEAGVLGSALVLRLAVSGRGHQVDRGQLRVGTQGPGGVLRGPGQGIGESDPRSNGVAKPRGSLGDGLATLEPGPLHSRPRNTPRQKGAEDPTRDTEIPTFKAGRMPA